MTEKNVHFYTLNVGQKDSHVIHFPNYEAAVVIDPGSARLINKLLHENLKIKYLPLILISHFDMDHMAGLNEVIKCCLDKPDKDTLKPECIFFNDHGFLKSEVCKRVKKILDDLDIISKENGIETDYAVAGTQSAKYFREKLAKFGIDARIIYPTRFQQGRNYKKTDFNLFSVLLYLMFDNKKILYTGDLPYAGWKQIEEPESLKSDVFKVPHHGGNISQNPDREMRKILEHVRPNFALISVGSNNRYHPVKELVEAIVTPSPDTGTGIQLFCTQMTDRCSTNRKQMKEKVEAFYNEEYKKDTMKNIIKNDFPVTALGDDNGTMCAGTIRVIFHKNSADVQTLPKYASILKMKKRFFSRDPLLCRCGT